MGERSVKSVQEFVKGEACPQVIELARNQKLVIHRARSSPSGASDPVVLEDRVQLVDANGTASLIIRVSSAGTMIELGGGPVSLSVQGDLAISAENLHLHGRDQVSISSGADVRIQAQETAVVEGKRQEITATRGDVSVYANDDVRIDGERIRMNC